MSWGARLACIIQDDNVLRRNFGKDGGPSHASQNLFTLPFKTYTVPPRGAAPRMPSPEKLETYSQEDTVFRFRIYPIALGLLAALTLTSCSDDDANPVAPAAQARVMAIHASPDAPGVDLLVDGNIAGTNLQFPNNTAYLGVASGTHNIKVNVTGTSTTVINASPDLGAGINYSVFAIDSVSKISALVLTDDLTAPASGKAHVRFVHLSPNAPAVDVAVTGGPVLFSNVSFKGYSAFTPVTAGTYDLEVRLAGTSTVVLPLPGITLTNGKIYTVFARGFAGGSGAQALGAQIIANN